MKEQQREAIKFFKGERGLSRLMHKMIERYRTLGRIGGSVRLQSLTAEEKEALSSLFRKDYTRQSSATISMEKFGQALHKTKFAQLEVQDILEGVHGGPIMTKAEEQERFNRDKKRFFQSLVDNFPHPYCQLWLDHVVHKGVGTRSIHSAYAQDAVRLKVQLEHVLLALSRLPGSANKYERLPVFASRISADPHAFDLDTEQGRFLINALQILRQEREDNHLYSSSPSAEQVTELLQSFGLIRDDVLNFVTCTGVLGLKSSTEETNRGGESGSEVIPFWRSAVSGRHVLNVPLREVVQVDSFLPAYSLHRTGSTPTYSLDDEEFLEPLTGDLDLRADNPQAVNPKMVFVVENSGVFSSILDHFSSSSLWPPLICTHGQFKLATLLLIDHLTKHGTRVYYSGDFDAEGLQMAARMIERHPAHVRPWRMSAADYLGCRSGLDLEAHQIRKLDTVRSRELAEVIKHMKQRGKTAYQEDVIELLVEDMKTMLGDSLNQRRCAADF